MIRNNDKYVFTDGCGFIDQNYLNTIVQDFFKRPYCSAIQIRMGGYKGMLLGYNNCKSGVKVYASASMKKFEFGATKDSVDLEVIRLATFMPGYLGKQILIMLWANGVPDYKLIQMQDDYVKKIVSYYKLKNIGPKYVYKHDLMQSIRFIQDKLYYLHKQEYHYENDPFICPLIKTVWYNRLIDVKKKFRIKDEKCWNLIGVIDPYGVLESGEVFAQFNIHLRDENQKEWFENHNITGQILVTRSPWVHPGDIRVLNALSLTEVPCFKEMVNVIVFSRKGDRPDFNKMGSGDLDGDIYWISWNSTFLRYYYEQSPDEPSDDPEPTPVESDELTARTLSAMLKQSRLIPSIISDDENENRMKCINNFIEYIRNDILGQIANLHIKIADKDKLNIHGSECKILSRMHWQAVDGQKHNSLVNSEEFFKIRKNHREIPDFLAEGKPRGRRTKVYESPGILGMMHRALKDEIDINELIELEYEIKILRKYEIEDHIKSNSLIRVHLKPLYERIVKPMCDEIRLLMIERNLISETDIYNSSCEFSKLVSLTDEAYKMKDEIRMLIYEIKDKYTQIFQEYQLECINKKIIKKPASETDKFSPDPLLNTSMKFVTYYHRNYSNKLSKKFKKNKHFKAFEREIKKERYYDRITLEYYKKVVKSQFAENREIISIVNQSQIFSPYWLLSNI